MSRGDAGRAGQRRGDELAEGLAHLGRLVELLPDRSGAPPTADQRTTRAAPTSGESTAARHLRAVGALLVTLQTSLDRRGVTRSAGDAVPLRPGRRPVRSDIGPVNGAGGPGTQLAAASARYIARDLAARRLSAFTSAEGYRLARALAAVGGVEAEIEQLLAEANTVTLHPGPLGDAVSHSPV